MKFSKNSGGFKFDLYQGQYMIDVKKSRIIKEEELGVGEFQWNESYAVFNISQDEEYLILGHHYNKQINDVLIIRIGSLSDFFYFSPIKMEAVLHLNDLLKINGVHMNR
jgi:hypothetical protein